MLTGLSQTDTVGAAFIMIYTNIDIDILFLLIFIDIFVYIRALKEKNDLSY